MVQRMNAQTIPLVSRPQADCAWCWYAQNPTLMLSRGQVVILLSRTPNVATNTTRCQTSSTEQRARQHKYSEDYTYTKGTSHV